MGGRSQPAAEDVARPAPLTGGIIGRERELAQLTGVVRERPVRGAAVVVAGEPDERAQARLDHAAWLRR